MNKEVNKWRMPTKHQQTLKYKPTDQSKNHKIRNSMSQNMSKNLIDSNR